MVVNATACSVWSKGKLYGSSGLALQAMAWLTLGSGSSRPQLEASVHEGTQEPDDDHVQNSPNCGISVKDQQRHHEDIPEYAVAKPAHDAESWRIGPTRAARLKEIQSLSSSSR